MTGKFERTVRTTGINETRHLKKNLFQGVIFNFAIIKVPLVYMKWAGLKLAPALTSASKLSVSMLNRVDSKSATLTKLLWFLCCGGHFELH